MTSGVPSAGSEDAPCSAGEDAGVPVGHTLERMNALLVLALTCTAIAGTYTRCEDNSEATIKIACVDEATVRSSA